RSRDLAATLPSGAISENSPSKVCSVAISTRNGAPFQGASGAARSVTSASWQPAAVVAACASVFVITKNEAASSSDAAAAANRPDRSIEPPPWIWPHITSKALAETWQSSGLARFPGPWRRTAQMVILQEWVALIAPVEPQLALYAPSRWHRTTALPPFRLRRVSRRRLCR